MLQTRLCRKLGQEDPENHLRALMSWAISGELPLGRARNGLHVTIPSITTHNGPAQPRRAAARLWEPLKKILGLWLALRALRSLQTNAVPKSRDSSKAFPTVTFRDS